MMLPPASLPEQCLIHPLSSQKLKVASPRNREHSLSSRKSLDNISIKPNHNQTIAGNQRQHEHRNFTLTHGCTSERPYRK
jgi:nitrate reductase beta subunit